jgi:hypothetical protein
MRPVKNLQLGKIAFKAAMSTIVFKYKRVHEAGFYISEAQDVRNYPDGAEQYKMALIHLILIADIVSKMN